MEKIKNILDYHNIILLGLKSKLLSFDDIIKEINTFKKKILKYVQRTHPILNKAKVDGKKILFEGAQGILLDIDHGTYHSLPLQILCQVCILRIWVSIKQIGL